MANKVRLGKRPAQFKTIAVKFPMPDGTEGVINVAFKYRTREEFGAWLDELMALSKARAEAQAGQASGPVYLEDEPVEATQFSMADMFHGMDFAAADHLTGCVLSWDLESPDGSGIAEISLEVGKQLASELPAAVSALMDRYRDACRDGRLGN